MQEGKKSIFVYFHRQHKSSCYIFHGPKTTAQKIPIYPKIFYINFKQRQSVVIGYILGKEFANMCNMTTWTLWQCFALTFYSSPTPAPVQLPTSPPIISTYTNEFWNPCLKFIGINSIFLICKHKWERTNDVKRKR